jgi:hypothetical protein
MPPNETEREQLEVDGRDAFQIELDELAESNARRLGALQAETGQPIMGLDLLYLKCCLEQLIGSYELPKVRLLFQRQVEALCGDFEEQLPAMKLAVSQHQAAMTAEQLGDHLGRNGRRRR